MRRNFLVVVIVALLGLFIYLIFSAEQEPTVLTTSVDVVHKTITGDQNSNSESETGLLSFLEPFAENFSDSIRDDMTMLAAAADPTVKFIKIAPGMRKEEMAELFQKKLGWTEAEKTNFLNLEKLINTSSAEGYYYPDAYILPNGAGGQETARLMIGRFNDEVLSRYASSTKSIVNVDTALKIASIIEREASGKKDMRLISGIMWNRMFKDMTLDIDATLQYAKGNEDNGWWPKVKPEDKFIDSPYNTYQNKGLTPTPISNPNLAAIDAALNPKKTGCLFYLHDKYRRIHCSATYKEHVRNIARYYGK